VADTINGNSIYLESMTTHLAVDHQLLEAAFRVGGLKTTNETVHLALEEFIRKRKAEDVINMFHSIDYDPMYDYKELRKRK